LLAEEPGLEPAFLQEAVVIRLLQGETGEGIALVRRLRDRFAGLAAPTAVMLLLEAIEHVFRGEPLEAAKASARAHRSATELGHHRMAQLALEMLLGARLILGRERGLRFLLARGARGAKAAGSRTRLARMAALRYAAALRFGGSPAEEDAEVVESAGDALSLALVRRLKGQPYDGPLAALADYLHRLVTTGNAAEPAWARAVPEVAVELTLDAEKREVVLAGGKRISFTRRRVLWQVLLELWREGGRTIEPADLYVRAWQLPFNPSRLNSLYVGIRRLRLLVEPDPSAPRIILVGAGGGYYMDTRRVRLVGTLPQPEVAEELEG
ncbi:MAG: hypothetical protein D6739_12290, partial [Nitrospirae bacterium]